MPTRALVLGGGGPVGIAWESGLIAGLEEMGVDLTVADFILGTSAGSFVGAHLSMGREPSAIVATQLRSQVTVSGSGDQGSQAAPASSSFQHLIVGAEAGSIPAEEVRRRVGELALVAKTISEEEFIFTFGGLLRSLPEDAWPEREYACTAVDALSGEFVVWKNGSGVGLGRAVASSCSVPGVYPPITINGRRYVDGGVRSSTNADIAKDYDKVLVVSVTNPNRDADTAVAERAQQLLLEQLQAIRDAGGSVELIEPDADSIGAFGTNMLDGSRRPVSAESGISQGKTEADRLGEFWN
ncbi:MAG TPA: patatin-like phospholipase family protein [Dehalococcoidia bacterium]|jgi:NTE family protein|nr:patatin-like phospholipase family protein [Dehalococcoidia bacterium]